jgi:hypothetical protein
MGRKIEKYKQNYHTCISRFHYKANLDEEPRGTAQDSLNTTDVGYAYDLASQRKQGLPIDYMEPHDVEIVTS